jgi:Lipase (class 3)
MAQPPPHPGPRRPTRRRGSHSPDSASDSQTGAAAAAAGGLDLPGSSLTRSRLSVSNSNSVCCSDPATPLNFQDHLQDQATVLEQDSPGPRRTVVLGPESASISESDATSRSRLSLGSVTVESVNSSDHSESDPDNDQDDAADTKTQWGFYEGPVLSQADSDERDYDERRVQLEKLAKLNAPGPGSGNHDARERRVPGPVVHPTLSESDSKATVTAQVSDSITDTAPTANTRPSSVPERGAGPGPGPGIAMTKLAQFENAGIHNLDEFTLANALFASLASYKPDPCAYLLRTPLHHTITHVLPCTLDRKEGFFLLAFSEYPVKSVYVACRGSVYNEDWSTNFKVVPRCTTYGWVHSGFYQRSKAISVSFLHSLHMQGYRIVFCGHSLGGATAFLSALGYISGFFDTEALCITFGQPLVGNNALRDFMLVSGLKNSLLLSFMRMTSYPKSCLC